ncbi:MAG TPA: AsmA-like C-terminal region-containing protein [Cyclobacteriaceae bacterium]|nr:AsmA-like C-terminal region-containing protein [Cyclobacteriaceae bacterium]
MKKVLIGLAAFLMLIIVSLALVPVLFKDKIKASIDKQLEKSLNADIYFDINKFSLSVFKNFPNVTATLGDFGIINRAPFEGEVLFAADKMEIEVNLKSILFEEHPRIKGILLVQPIINIIALEDGTANYDITVSTDDQAETEAEESEFYFSIDHWEIIDGYLMVDYRPASYYMELLGVNHKGSGDFSQTIFDLSTFTSADTVIVAYDGVTYLSNNSAKVDAVISISEDYTRYAFKENEVWLNDFAFSFAGWFKMNEEDYDMDISFETQHNTFKSLLSLVPGMYNSSFADLKTSGDLAFNGLVKGKFSDEQMPAFNVSLMVKDGFFQYPELPAPVSNIQVDLFIDNQDGIIDNTFVHLKQMHIDFGSNPFDASVIIENLKDYPIDASLNGRLNLAELTSMFPIEGVNLRGTFNVDAKAKGMYDGEQNKIPALDLNMSLQNGFVKSADFPMPLEDLSFKSNVRNTSGKMDETVITLSNFNMKLDDERFTADLVLRNLNDYTWNLKASGGIDLGNITKIFPLDGMSLDGKIKADLQTQGRMSDLEAGRYDRMPTSGNMSITAFNYKDAELPYEINLATAQASFDPAKITVSNVRGTIGKSDFAVDGVINNYMEYILSDAALLKGRINYNASLLDLNEFMEETEEAETETEEAYGVIPIPQNLEFILRSKVSTVKVMDLTLNNAEGDIVLKDGIANLSGLKFNMLGGSFVVNGSYNTQDINKPSYDFGLKIDNLSIPQAFSTFTTIQAFVPVAEMIVGNFSTDFKVSGLLQQDLMPDLSSVTGSGLVKIAQAALRESPVISSITTVTKLEDANEVSIKDVIMSASIDNGRLSVKPFDVKMGNYTTTIAGSTGMDGSINYNLKMNVPAGKLGADFSGLVSQFAGGRGAVSPDQNIPITIALGGTYANPRPVLVLDEQKEQLRDAVAAEVEERGREAIQQAIKGTEAEKLVGGILGRTTTDTTKRDSGVVASPIPVTKDEAKEKAEEEARKLQEEAQKKIQNLLKRKGGG